MSATALNDVHPPRVPSAPGPSIRLDYTNAFTSQRPCAEEPDDPPTPRANPSSWCGAADLNAEQKALFETAIAAAIRVVVSDRGASALFEKHSRRNSSRKKKEGERLRMEKAGEAPEDRSKILVGDTCNC